MPQTWTVLDCLGYQVSYHEQSVYVNSSHANTSTSEGRGAAAEVDGYLSAGSTRLPSAGGIKTRVRHNATLLFFFSISATLT